MFSIILTSPDEIALKIGNFSIYWYGICIAIGILVGFAISYSIAKKYYKKFFNCEILYDVATISIISGFVFARIYYCLVNFNYYSDNLTEIFMFRQGGLSIHGGILGGLLTGIIYAHFKKLPILKLADVFAYGLIIAQSIGRWGNFFNSEAYGIPSKLISVYIPVSKRVFGYENYEYFHPTFLYESIFDLLIFFILFFLIRKLKFKFDGLIFASYLILYSFVRFFIEELRLDSTLNIGSLHIAQIMSLVIIFFATIFIVIMTNHQYDKK